MDKETEAAITAVIEGGLSHYTVQLLEGVEQSFAALATTFANAAVTVPDDGAADRMMGAHAGVVACRLTLQATIAKLCAVE